jgi:hypothetical protein
MRLLIDADTAKRQALVAALKPQIVFPEAAQEGGDDLLYFQITEWSAIEPSLHKLLTKGIIILSIEDKIEVLLVRTVSRIG